MTSPTDIRRLYRLRGVAPTIEAMVDAVAPALDKVADDRLEILTEELDVPAVLIDASINKDEAPHYAALRRTTQRDLSRPSRRPASLLLLAIDDEVYACAFGQGHLLIPSDLKDRRFGLTYAIRRVDPNEVNDIVRHTPGFGQTDITLVPGGTSVRAIGIEEHAQIVRTIGGHLDDRRLTASTRRGTRASSVQGGVGLRLHLGVDGDDLVADIREIARTCREERPRRDLEFVEYITEISDPALITRLEDALDTLLGGPDEGRIVASVPTGQWENHVAARAFGFRINSVEEVTRDGFDLAYVLARARVQRPGARVTALRDGHVAMYDDSRARRADLIRSHRALRWLEADVTVDSRRFHLLDEHWYEVGATYLRTIRASTERLVVDALTDRFPAWDLAHNEHHFCEAVEAERHGHVCMDGKLIKTEVHNGNGVEICDILCPDGTLVVSKRAERAGGLSHLFKQVLVAVQALQYDPAAASEFRARVARESGGHLQLPAGYQPTKVVLAILLKDGRPLTVDTLFPFAQVALLHTARILHKWGVEIEVVGVRGRPCTCSTTGRAA